MDQARVSIAAVPIMPPSTGVRRLWSSTACPACEGPSDDWLSSSGGRAYLNAMQTTSDTLALIGNTPLVRLKGPSEESGCDIYGKCEFVNPGASVKDRAALFIVEDAEAKEQLAPGGTIVEGTAGNTGIGLALVANAKGYKTIIVMPETQSREKMDTLRALGAELVLVPAAPYSNPGHFVHTSRRIAEETGNAIWAKIGRANV